MGMTPAIPSAIPETQAAQMPNLDEAIHSAVSAINAPLPPTYVSGSVPSTPTIQPVKPYQPQNTNNQPLTNQATSIKEARRKNAYANIANVVGNAANNIQQKKQLELTNKIKDVMQAKQNIANAEIVLQNDPNNKQAQMVKAANMQRMNAILSEPKNVKAFEKAFDISFTDMEKNKTPEVSALLAAQKDVKNAGAFKYDNPQEAAVAMQASRSSIDANKDAQMASARQPQGQPVASATPYADKVMSKDLPSIEKNSLYDAALKRQEDAQKQLNQYIIPEMIRAEVQAAKDGNANSRANLQSATTLYKDFNDNTNRIAVEDKRAAATIQAARIRASAEYATTAMRVAAMEKIRLSVGGDLATKLAQQDKAQVEKTVNDLQAAIQKRALDLQALTIGNDKADYSVMQQQQKDDQTRLKAYQALQDRLNKVSMPTAPTDNKDTKPTDTGPGFFSGVGKSLLSVLDELGITDLRLGTNSDASSASTVGSSDSDESGDDSDTDDNSDDYGNYGSQ